jgi:hypothetical protein
MVIFDPFLTGLRHDVGHYRAKREMHVREKPLHTVAVVIIFKPIVSRRTASEAKIGTDSAI